MTPKPCKSVPCSPLPDSLTHERVLNAHQAAELCGLSVGTLRRMQRAGKLPPAIRVSERRLGWRVRDLLDYLTNSVVSTKELIT